MKVYEAINILSQFSGETDVESPDVQAAMGATVKQEPHEPPTDTPEPIVN